MQKNMRVTDAQALDAVLIIAGLVEQCGTGAVELRLGPPVVEEMRALMRKIGRNQIKTSTPPNPEWKPLPLRART